MGKRRKVYRFLRLIELTAGVVRSWWDEFSPEWDAEDEEKKKRKEEEEGVVDEDPDPPSGAPPPRRYGNG